MKRLHIAIFTEPNKAHIYAAVPLCHELAKRGHRVTYATDDRHAHLVVQAGSEPVTYHLPKFELPEESLRYLWLPPAHPKRWANYVGILNPASLCFAAVIFKQLYLSYKHDRPDLVLYDRYTLAGRILAHRLHLNAIQILPHFAYPEGCIHWENGMCQNPPALVEYAKMEHAFLWGFGIEDSDSLWHVESLNISFVPRAFQYHAELFDRRYFFAGPCVNRPFAHVWVNRSGGKPIILIPDTTAGYAEAEYYNVIIDAFSGLNYHVILSISTPISGGALKSLPANFEINENASHLEILPHATLLISQGGLIGTLEAIYHGVPIISLPLAPFHEEVAHRIVELGLGIQLSRWTVTAAELRDGVERVLADSAMRERIKCMQHEFKHSGGVVVAADKVEEFLRGP